MNHSKPYLPLDLDLATLVQSLPASPLAQWNAVLSEQVEAAVYRKPHGKREAWFAALAALPALTPSSVALGEDTVRVGQADDLSDTQQAQLREVLQTFIPWRKGPFELFGIRIETEWRSDWKWQRVAPYLSELKNKRVLDVGCGSGYHLWRMRAAGAQQVIGIDPSLFFLMQFYTFKQYLPHEPVYFLPLRSEDLPDFQLNGTHSLASGFDTVFSMGVLYHRRSPLDHLQELKNALCAGGELVLETLVVAGDESTLLMPEERYGKMRNVWFIPSVPLLELWLRRLGFVNIRTVDVTQTCVAEQRSTDWMRFESLRDFLDPADQERTIEGYPAPRRAVVIANVA